MNEVEETLQASSSGEAGARRETARVAGEEFLVQSARRGDLEAFETLYHRTVGRVYALCRRLTGDPVRAEDLVQEVYVKAWQKLESFRGESALATWLHRISVNTVLGDHRSRARRGEDLRSGDSVEDLGLADRPASLADGLDIERALELLPPVARSVFVLHDVEGYCHPEISEMTGMAVGTSKANLHRARTLLRKALQ